jgi:hypothetical protein
LEIGALAAWTPASAIPVTSYVAEVVPELFTNPSTMILTVKPERTFWEKITILHKEAFRINGRVPNRYSIHYYDIFKLTQTPVKDVALNDLELLSRE